MGLQRCFQSFPLVRDAMGPGTLPLPAGLEVFLVPSLSKIGMKGNRFFHIALSLTLVGSKPKTGGRGELESVIYLFIELLLFEIQEKLLFYFCI